VGGRSVGRTDPCQNRWERSWASAGSPWRLHYDDTIFSLEWRRQAKLAVDETELRVGPDGGLDLGMGPDLMVLEQREEQ
jgi:hypothetical protein